MPAPNVPRAVSEPDAVALVDSGRRAGSAVSTAIAVAIPAAAVLRLLTAIVARGRRCLVGAQDLAGRVDRHAVGGSRHEWFAAVVDQLPGRIGAQGGLSDRVVQRAT